MLKNVFLLTFLGSLFFCPLQEIMAMDLLTKLFDPHTERKKDCEAVLNDAHQYYHLANSLYQKWRDLADYSPAGGLTKNRPGQEKVAINWHAAFHRLLELEQIFHSKKCSSGTLPPPIPHDKRIPE